MKGLRGLYGSLRSCLYGGEILTDYISSTQKLPILPHGNLGSWACLGSYRVGSDCQPGTPAAWSVLLGLRALRAFWERSAKRPNHKQGLGFRD